MTVEILDPQMGPEPHLRFRPNSWAQERALLTEAREALYSGHLGSSKTRTLCEKGDAIARKWPRVRGVVARKKRVDLGLSTLRAYLEKTITPAHRAWGWRPGAEGGSTLFYPNGSEVLFIGLDNPGKLLSAEFDYVLVDQAEEIEEEEWQSAAGRLRNMAAGFRQVMGFCNPSHPEHFLYHRFRPDDGSHVDFSDEVHLPDGRVVAAGRIVRECIIAGLMDNAENLDPEYLALIHSYSGRWYERYVLGRWVAFEGLIFDCWDSPLHVIGTPSSWYEWGGYPPPSWKRYRSLDFGFSNPFVCQWWARAPEGAFYLYREIYMTRTLVQAHREQIRRLEAEELGALNRHIKEVNDSFQYSPLTPLTRLPVVLSVADQEDAEARAQLEALGMATFPAVKDRQAGMQTVYEHLQPRLAPSGKRASGLYFLRNARVQEDESLRHAKRPTCTWEEFPRLRHAQKRESARDKSQSEFLVVGDDHGYDATRYLLQTLRASGELRVVRLFSASEDDR